MPTSYVIGGGKGGVGKSTLAINLAIFLASKGKAVVVVDCDTRQRTSAKFFGRTDRYSIPFETIEKDLLRSLSEEDRALADDAYRHFDAVVFDAPGDIEISKPLFRIADVVVLPSRPQFPRARLFSGLFEKHGVASIPRHLLSSLRVPRGRTSRRRQCRSSRSCSETFAFRSP